MRRVLGRVLKGEILEKRRGRRITIIKQAYRDVLMQTSLELKKSIERLTPVESKYPNASQAKID